MDRKRLIFQSWHRGTRENDLIFGAFADACLETLTVAECTNYGHLLNESDLELFQWVTYDVPIPRCYHDIMTKIKTFHGILPIPTV